MCEHGSVCISRASCDHGNVVLYIQISNQKPPTGRESLAYRRQAGDTTTVAVRSAPPERLHRSGCRGNYQTSRKPYIISANSPPTPTPTPYRKKLWFVGLSSIRLRHVCDVIFLTVWHLALSSLVKEVEVSRELTSLMSPGLWVPCLSYSLCTCRTEILCMLSSPRLTIHCRYVCFKMIVNYLLNMCITGSRLSYWLLCSFADLQEQSLITRLLTLIWCNLCRKW